MQEKAAKSTRKQAKKTPVQQRNSPHILAYIMLIDRAIRNGDYPNTNKMNKEKGWALSRSTFGRYIDILRDTYGAPLEFDFKRTVQSTFHSRQTSLARHSHGFYPLREVPGS